MKRYSLLIVDDDKNLLYAMKRTLRRDGYNLFFATKAQKALDKLAGTSVDLVISDYQMPGMNGVTFLQRVRNAHPQVLTIMMTGIEDINIAAQAINQAGVYKFIVKPWESEDLRITVRRALENLEVVQERDFLLQKVKERDAAIEKLEAEFPGISKIVRDEEGNIVSQ